MRRHHHVVVSVGAAGHVRDVGRLHRHGGAGTRDETLRHGGRHRRCHLHGISVLGHGRLGERVVSERRGTATLTSALRAGGPTRRVAESIGVVRSRAHAGAGRGRRASPALGSDLILSVLGSQAR